MTKELSNDVNTVVSWLAKSDFHSREKAFITFAARGVESYILMGAVLCKSRDEKDWENADCQNMKEYCENERRISYTQAIRMMTIWDALQAVILTHYEAVKNISFVNLYEVARVADKIDPEDMGAFLEQASLDTERGFKANIREIEGKVASDNCDCLNAEKFFYKCRTCKKLVPIELKELERKFIDGT